MADIQFHLFKQLKNLIFGWKALGGECYYTFKSLIDENGKYLTGSNKPTVDHKISVLFGFLNKIRVIA